MDNGQDLLPESALRELTDGLMVLWRAFHYARDASADRWEFAVEIQQFCDLGLGSNELRWLVARGFAEHGQETSICGDARRSFEPTDGLTFSKTSALVLTESGAALAKLVNAAELKTKETATDEKRRPAGESSSEPAAGNGQPQAALKPNWDSNLRELRVGEAIVKWFRVPATSQESVLSAFEEEAWPAYIDDPLPGVTDGVPKQRLNSVIMRLNSHQTNRLIHFHADGRGEGIGWNLRAADRANGETKPADRVN